MSFLLGQIGDMNGPNRQTTTNNLVNELILKDCATLQLFRTFLRD